MKLLYHDAAGRITQTQSGAMSPADLDNLRARGFSFVVAPDAVDRDRHAVDEQRAGIGQPGDAGRAADGGNRG
jgi:hypothetical protein